MLYVKTFDDDCCSFLQTITNSDWEGDLRHRPYAEIGEALFVNGIKDLSHKDTLKFLGKILLRIDRYVQVRVHLQSWTARGMSLKQILIQCFMNYIATIWKTSDDFPVYHMVYNSRSLVLEVIPAIVAHEFPPAANFWNHSGIERQDSDLHRDFMGIVCKLSDRGLASVEVILYSLKSAFLKPYRPTGYRLLCQGLLRGKIEASFIEDFFSRKTTNEIRAGRMALYYVWTTTRTIEEYKIAVKSFFKSDEVSEEMFETFKKNFEQTMLDLKNELPKNNRMEPKRSELHVCEAIGAFYHRNELAKNQMTDIFCEAICQRYDMATFIAQTVRMVGQDPNEASLWEHPCHSGMNIRSLPILNADLHSPHDKPEDPHTMGIPSYIDVEIIVCNRGLNELERYFRVLAGDDELPIVGVDAEWSMYCKKTKANLLQVAGPHRIFLIDLDAFDENQLSRCYNIVFGPHYPVWKIGYQFREDLAQLRRTCPTEKVLYAPSRVVCITRLIMAVQKHAPEETEKGFGTAAAAGDFSERALKSMGLAKMTEMFLGCRLDKAEQLSVWTRRPLRVSQQRYAALDAFVLVRLFQKFDRFCQFHNINLLPILQDLPEPSSKMPFMLVSEFDPFKHATVTAFDMFPIENDYHRN
ncbi:hypothetical protein L596_028008 [Steinernema carpocapsae]|uniref:3'-5' exonuclease domain-containing protein n=1 Tax=Steinernema carpocapsae TaxID=34508 RepID=A0A4U5LX67_STECR|nr:hypothetical protein L596_028008 [Steinernema carpocapsae]